MKTNYPDNWYDLDKNLYKRSIRVFKTVRNVLGLKMNLYAENQPQTGDIFLFNHFSRLETFIPQFLIYEQTGEFCCAIAAGEFFKTDNVLAKYLKNVGVFPHDHNNLFPLLTSQVFRGRKVIIFPEGGIIKDHRVIDDKGNYGYYSRTTGQYRKQHTGAAVLAQGIEAVKIGIRRAYHNKDQDRLLWWQKQLHLDSLDQMLSSALKQTYIIPANITFYPIRTTENAMLKAVEFFTENLSLRATEELMIEGNIILKNTDMDIRMGNPLKPFPTRLLGCNYLLNHLVDNVDSIAHIFAFQANSKNWQQQGLGHYFKVAANATRDHYMAEIYLNVTINLSHLSSTLIMHLARQNHPTMNKQRFFRVLYIAVKFLQSASNINLHRSLLNPLDYSDIINHHNNRFENFISEAKHSGLIGESETEFNLLPKLLEDQKFDRIRLENIISVYDNEARPISAVRDAVVEALAACDSLGKQTFADWHFDDECRDLNWEQHAYLKPAFKDINQHETATESGMPFLLHPAQNLNNGIGVLLIHGLLSSPAELRKYGEYLVDQGYTIMGARLKGHGSSPYALQNSTRDDWYASVLRGFNILRAFCDKIFLVGFSTGGALALKLAAMQYPEIIGITAVAAPVKFINPSLMLVPLLNRTNKWIDRFSGFEGIKPFFENDSEHPTINYRSVPVKSLYQLRLLIDEMNNFLPLCKCPVQLLQGDNDPVVSSVSAQELFNRLVNADKQLQMISASRHGILSENIDNTWMHIDKFIHKCLGETIIQ